MRKPARWFWYSALGLLLVGFGVVLNPWIDTTARLFRVVVWAEIIGASGWLAWEFRRAARRPGARGSSAGRSSDSPCPATVSAASAAGAGAPWLLLLTALLWANLYRDRWLAPRRMPDDDQLYAESVDWPTTREHLLAPIIDHVMVPARLISWLVVRLSDESTRDTAGAVVSAVLFLPALPLLFLLGRREWRSDLAGLLVVTLFALTSSYREIILWYTASCQWLVSFDLLLLALLLAGGSLERHAGWRVVAASLLALAAPLGFSFGVVVGPITSLWLATGPRRPGGWRALAMILAPSAGTLMGLAMVIPRLVGVGRSLGFESGEGVITSTRLAIDVLVLRNLGVAGPVPPPWFCFMLPLVPLFLTLLLRRRARPGRLFAMLAMIALAYGATIPFRTWVAYHDLVNWTRYQLFPQLGFALLVTEASSVLFPRMLQSAGGRLTPAQGVLAACLALFLAWLHDGLVT